MVEISEYPESSLPGHGRVDCQVCFSETVRFDETTTSGSNWRITNNPLSWGSRNPEVLVLGFSKGPTQSGDLETTPHDEIAYKKGRLNVGKILKHVGLLDGASNEALKSNVDLVISDQNGRFHFASLIRCTVERYDTKRNEWSGSGGGMLDKFIATDFGAATVANCTNQFLGNLPSSLKLVVMFGLGTKQNYLNACFNVFQAARPGDWQRLNEVSYTDGKIVVVHVEHFSAQGALIPNWLGVNDHPRNQLGLRAKESVSKALDVSQF